MYVHTYIRTSLHNPSETQRLKRRTWHEKLGWYVWIKSLIIQYTFCIIYILVKQKFRTCAGSKKEPVYIILVKHRARLEKAVNLSSV